MHKTPDQNTGLASLARQWSRQGSALENLVIKHCTPVLTALQEMEAQLVEIEKDVLTLQRAQVVHVTVD